MSPVHGIFGWSLFWFETMYTSCIPLYLFLCSLLPFSVLFFIPPYAIVRVDVGDVASRDLFNPSNDSGMTGTLSIWSLANNVHLHNYYLHIYYYLYTFTPRYFAS